MSSEILVVPDIHFAKFNKNSRLASKNALEGVEFLVNEVIPQVDPELIILLGDLIQASDIRTDYENAIRVLRPFAPYSDRVIALPGNHESKKMGFPLFQDLLYGLGFDSRLYGSIELQDINVAWVSAFEENGQGRLPARQKAWLQKKLQTLEEPLVILTHFPFRNEVVRRAYLTGPTPDLSSSIIDPECLDHIRTSGQVPFVASGHYHHMFQEQEGSTHYSIFPAFSLHLTPQGENPPHPCVYALLSVYEKYIDVEIFSQKLIFQNYRVPIFQLASQ